MQKVILFILSIISLCGFAFAISEASGVRFRWDDFFLVWLIFSFPVIIFFLAKAIFKF